MNVFSSFIALSLIFFGVSYLSVTLPIVPGHEIAGEIIKIGPDYEIDEVLDILGLLDRP